ncbi:hypothetical protein K525DRAFT_200142 [Schizophyllum commune Loenen D]|nr:hypothetical protein K525DRAFT_200142 [Schizophyllum commune Loenen D]
MDSARPAALSRHMSMYLPSSTTMTPIHAPSPAFPPQPTNRRHSSMNPRRPLRSSPLAGPALSSEGAVDDDNDTETIRARPSRISSTPEFSQRAPSLLYPPSRRESMRTPFNTNASDIPPVPPLPPNLTQAPPSPSPTPPSRRASILSVKSLIRKKSKVSVQSPAAPSPSSSVPKPYAMPATSSAPDPRASKNSNLGVGRLRTRSATSLPDHVRPRGPDRRLGSEADVTAPRPRTATRAPQDSSWLTQNTFAETPRFTRLGLGSGVVMPVPAKKARRVSRAPSSTSMREEGNGGRQSPTQSKPSLSLTRSNSSSRESVLSILSEPPQIHSSATSIASNGSIGSIGSECAPIREEAEDGDTDADDEGIVIGRRPEARRENSNATARLEQQKEDERRRWNSIKSVKSLGRSRKTSDAPQRRLSVLSTFGSDDTHGGMVKPVSLGKTTGGPLAAAAVKMEVTLQTSPPTASGKASAPQHKQTEATKPKTTIRRLMRRLSTVGRRQATL